MANAIEDNANWQEEIKSRYLTQEKYRKASPWLTYRKRGTWWRLCVRISKLPWIAIVSIIASCALTGFVVISILNSTANLRNNPYTTTVENGTSTVIQIITVECETDVSVEACEQRVKERAESSEFQRAMTETHLFITIIVCWVGALIYFVSKAMRIRKRNRYLECLPHDSITLWNTTERNGGNAAAAAAVVAAKVEAVADYPSSPVADLVLDLPVHYEMERSIILSKFLHTYDPHCSKSADPNWGCTTGRRKGTHFRTTMSSSLHALEDLATAYDSRLGSRKDQTARQYVNTLKERFTVEEISHEAMDRVLHLYERAKFGQGSVSEDMFQEYGNCMYRLSMEFQRLGEDAVVAPLPEATTSFSSSLASESSPVQNQSQFPTNVATNDEEEDDDAFSVASEITSGDGLKQRKRSGLVRAGSF